MKAISLWEPWASLIACGAKRFETRSWATSYRGTLLICASKGGLPVGDLRMVLASLQFQGGLAPLIGLPLDFACDTWEGVGIEHLQFGNAVAVCELVGCATSDSLTHKQIGTDAPFGDFTPGRFAWLLHDVRRLARPFPVKGRQGFFNVDDALVAEAVR